MCTALKSAGGWLTAGVLAGMLVAWTWPRNEVLAVATDRHENFAICTGPVDENVEALYYLDYLTGELKAVVINPVSYKFGALFTRSVVADFGAAGTASPRYLMVTGMANMRRTGGQVQAGASLLYVAEVTSGFVAAYAVPWNRSVSNSGRVQVGELQLLDVRKMSAAEIRDQE